MQRWKPSGAPLNARPWKEANNGPRIGFDGSYSNSSKRLITGAGSTALWGINHLWTSNKTTTKNGKDRVKYCDHKKGGREGYQHLHVLQQGVNAVWPLLLRLSLLRSAFAEVARPGS